MSSKKEKFCIVEKDSLVSNDFLTVWGPFSSREKANKFCNARIALLASEWDDSCYIVDSIIWRVLPMNSGN